MIYFIDFDGTIADTTIMKETDGNWKDKQKLIPLITILPHSVSKIQELNKEKNDVYIVSGNVGSTIKKAIKYFHIPISEQNVFGYRQGMPMENIQRKISVIRYAIKKLSLEERLGEISYIGDEEDDKTACESIGIKFLHVEEWTACSKNDCVHKSL